MALWCVVGALLVAGVVGPACAVPVDVQPASDNANQIQHPENIHFSQSELEVFEDMGMDAEELWDCGWYSSDLPRGAVALASCKDYVAQRSLNCIDWTKAYGQLHPKADRHIPLEEVHIKCRHVKDKLDQLEDLPGATASCMWCMQNVNTN